jgi:hippurate hydrolase
MTSEDFSEFSLAGVPSAMFYVGAVNPGKFAESKKSGKQLPGLHSSLWAPDRKPTLMVAMEVEVTSLLEALRK